MQGHIKEYIQGFIQHIGKEIGEMPEASEMAMPSDKTWGDSGYTYGIHILPKPENLIDRWYCYSLCNSEFLWEIAPKHLKNRIEFQEGIIRADCIGEVYRERDINWPEDCPDIYNLVTQADGNISLKEQESMLSDAITKLTPSEIGKVENLFQERVGEEGIVMFMVMARENEKGITLSAHMNFDSAKYAMGDDNLDPPDTSNEYLDYVFASVSGNPQSITEARQMCEQFFEQTDLPISSPFDDEEDDLDLEDDGVPNP